MTQTLDSFTGQRQIARQDLRLAIQLVSAVSQSYLPGGHEACLRWWGPEKLVGRAIGSRRALRAALSLAPFELQLIEQASPRVCRILERLELHHISPAAAAIWLDRSLAEALPRGYSKPLFQQAGAMGPGRWLIESGKAFSARPAALNELSRGYEWAQRLLTEVASGIESACTPVCCAPPGGDLGFRLSLPGASVSVGYSPGDASLTEPFLFVIPWPVPPQHWRLERGFWHQQGWQGAVLPLGYREDSPGWSEGRDFLREGLNRFAGVRLAS